jgi:fused signal recognition particle receptor
MRFFGGKKETPESPATTPGGEADSTPAETPKSGFFERMKQAVSRTRESLSSKIESIAALTRTVDEHALEELETALITSDLGVQTTTDILDALRERARRQAIDGGEELRGLLKAQLRAILEATERPVPSPEAPPKVTFLVGKNYHQRQTGRLEPRPGPFRSALRRGYLPRSRHRTTGGLGLPLRRGND